MELTKTPITSGATPPASPYNMRSPGSEISPQSVIGSPFSVHSLGRSPYARAARPGSPHLRSPPEFRPNEEPEAPRDEPRLIIQKLVLINYKSYAGRQEVGPFNENFTAVVGPNGSGKSNVIDSLLFVFGFRAKKMRQDKLSGLIHKSDKNPSLQFARVEVHFRTIGIPDSELVLAREVRRDGSNFYSLNDRRCTYGEVSDLLQQRGIDLRHKRFLILQGEVESIALMPPKAENDGDDGLLEYLEDIIGTSSYKSKIEELDDLVEKLKVDCGEKQRRVEIVSKDLKKLDSERAATEAFMLNQNKATIARSKLYQLQASRLNHSIGFKSQDIEDQMKTVAELEEEMTRKKSSLANLEALASKNQGQADSLKQELKDVTKALKAAQLEQVKAKQRLDQLSVRTRKAERNLIHAKSEHKQAEIWVENFRGDSSRLSQKLKDLSLRETEERKKLEIIQAELHASTKDLHDELESLQIQAEPWREKIATNQQEAKALDSSLSDMRTQLERSSQREKDCRSSAQKIIEEGHAAKKEVRMLSKHHEALSSEQENIVKELKSLAERREAVSQQLNQLRPEVSAAQEVRTSSQNRNRLESELMRLKIPGLYGRLGSLGSIDDKYDVAVSTAGSELNNFVVDTVETAKTCIEELRKRSIGRAKFMVLNKLRPATKAAADLPAKRLLDLIKPVDPLFMKAFASVLGDTLVVDSPDDATKVAFGGPRRHKVVTLGGMLVNTSGQMGGGGSPSRGLMAKSTSTMSTEELEALEKRLAALELDYAEVREQSRRLEARKEELTNELPKTRIALDKEKMSLSELENRMLQIKEEHKRLQAEVKTLEQSASKCEQSHQVKTETLLEQRKVLESQSHSIETSIQNIQEKILKAGGLRLREQSVRVSDIQKDTVDTRKQLEEGEKKAAEEASRMKKLQEDISKLEAELDECNSSNVSQEGLPNTDDLEAKSRTLTAEHSHLTNESESAKAEANVLRTSIESLRAQKIESENTLDTLNRSCKDDQNRWQEIQNRLSRLRLHDVSIAQKLQVANTNSAPAVEDVMEEDDLNVPSSAQCEGGGEPGPKARTVSDAGRSLLTELSPDELEDLNEAELKATIQAVDEATKEGRLDMEVIQRYRARYAEYVERKAVGDDALQSYENAKDEVQRLRKRRYSEFMNGFLQISSKLKEMYQLITIGGNAELELVDTMDPFAEGILFSVMPPKKSWRNIANLSGGEKTLSSLALVFALHHYKPTPLYVMDEIDAALDFRNVSIIANYIKERTKNGQFIVISLRNNMFELASRLVGVYKVDNKTKSVTLQID